MLIRAGYLGKLTIELPWQSWFNKPVKIHIEDMYILAVPAAGSNVCDILRVLESSKLF